MSLKIHDHFDGSAHCVECKGFCNLNGEDRAVTDLVRWTLEFAFSVHDGWMWDFTEKAMQNLVGSARFMELKERARISCAKVNR